MVVARQRAAAGIAGLAVFVSICAAAEAASCRHYPQGVRTAINKHIEAVRALEREAADRLKNLDMRPFHNLAERARTLPLGHSRRSG